MTLQELNSLSGRVLDAAFVVHTGLGPGLLESTYQACLMHELAKRGLRVEAQVAVPVVYGGLQLLDVGYRIDILVEGELQCGAAEGWDLSADQWVLRTRMNTE